MPPRGLQSTFKNRRKAPDHFLPIITQGFNPGRPCASEDFSPGRLWETLGGPVRRRISVLGLGPAPYTLHQRLSPCCLATHNARPVGPPGALSPPGPTKSYTLAAAA